ncbi:Serine carboxypeptidase-like 45 [Camellia lanceoleosa]|uniref:Serine carboxypeptidase-like 45 n=1 Tax=Camellia lanceoleosa TaxID=1840588 RepID=A0ACC0F3L4_9ERIC|nr:Serine carboxypeptidase-like 45 [Camellia lanceoleosa]
MSMFTQAWLIMETICALQICLRVESLSEADKILVLPGQLQVSFQQKARYITVDEKQDRALFYYFAEAETDPSSKPLVLWLNGGVRKKKNIAANVGAAFMLLMRKKKNLGLGSVVGFGFAAGVRKKNNLGM